MINSILLSEKERKILQAALLKKLNAAYTHVLEYEGDLSICAFIQMFFEMDISLTITTGKFADNIVLLEQSDFLQEKEKYSLQPNVKMNLNELEGSEVIVGEKLLNIECIQKPDEEYCWQLNFIFENKVLHIDALIDELGFSVK